MNTEDILYAAVAVVIVAFISLGYIFIVGLKRRMVNHKIDKFSSKNGKKITQNEIDKIMAYIHKNQKYILPSIYKKSMSKIDMARMRMKLEVGR